jgi:hypothetical protein
MLLNVADIGALVSFEQMAGRFASRIVAAMA